MITSAQRKTLLFFLLIVVNGLSAEAIELRFRSQAAVSGPVVVLADLAEIHGGEAHAAGALAARELFPAPSADRPRRVRQREVRELLTLQGVDLKGLQFGGAETVHLTAATVPPRKEATPPAPVTQPVTQPVAEPVAEPIVVTARALERGATIRAADIVLQPRPETGPAARWLQNMNVLTDLDDAIGMEVTRGLAAGQPLDASMVTRPLLIRRGEAITVVSKAPGVSVQTLARALEDAALGDLVLIESVVNRKRYTGRVTGLQRAEVYASGTTVASPPAAAAETRNARLKGIAR